MALEPLTSFPGLYVTNCSNCGKTLVVSLPDEYAQAAIANDTSLCFTCTFAFEHEPSSFLASKHLFGGSGFSKVPLLADTSEPIT